MGLFDRKKPFFIRFYFNEKDWKFQKDSNELPVFYKPPSDAFCHSFGLCVLNEHDVITARLCFDQKTLPNHDGTQSYFLYILGDACRQTDVLQKASESGYPLIIEKGAFLSPDDMKHLVSKLKNDDFALVECGSSFGYANRVLDPRSLYLLKDLAPHFGVCVTDLFEPNNETYQYHPDWLSNENFMDALYLAIKNFEPSFYVSKESTIQSNHVCTQSDLQTSKISWNGAITENIKFNRNQLTIIAGPCMLESLELGLEVGRFLKNLCEEFDYQYIFKSSFDKANRTSAKGVRGPGIDQGLDWLNQIKQELNVAVLTDVHTVEQVNRVGSVADILQIPAFLCRDTQLLLACAKLGKTIQIKKGQWASAQDMLNIVSFLSENNFHKVVLAERGSCFGYNNLIVDFRSLVDMSLYGNPVVFDATHAVQLPGAKNGQSSGLRHMVPTLARAAVAAGIDGLFMEVHPNPECALSDADTQISFETVYEILKTIGNIN